MVVEIVSKVIETDEIKVLTGFFFLTIVTSYNPSLVEITQQQTKM